MGRDHASEFAEYMSVRREHLRRTAYLLCRDVQEVDDLVQTAGMKLFVSWRHARVAENLDAYAHTVLVRAYLDDRRRGWWRVLLNDRAMDRAGPSVDTDTRLALMQALGGLPARQRAVVVLRFYADLSVRETAAALQCSPGTVKSHTHHAMATLRHVMQDGGIPTPVRAWARQAPKERRA